MKAHPAALAVLLAALPSPSSADGSSSHGYIARRAALTALDRSHLALSVSSGGRPLTVSLVSGRQQAATPRAVFVDGILTEMDEDLLRRRIASGALTVVRPGTSLRWVPDGTPEPDYPPAWF